MQSEFPRLIAFDLDETLLDRKSRLPEENRAALLRAAEKGCVLVAASGRAFDTFPEEILSLPGMQYAICGNGTEICRLPSGERLRRLTLSQVCVEQVLRCAAGKRLTYEAFLKGKAYAQTDYIADPGQYMTDEQTVRYVQSTRIPVSDIVAFIRKHADSLEGIALVVRDLDTRKEMLKTLEGMPELYVTTSVPRLIEISNPAGGKHRALQYLCEELGISPSDTMAFGNADNDGEMLRFSGIGVAVKNGSPACIEAADYVTDAFDEMGVAKALHTILNL